MEPDAAPPLASDLLTALIALLGARSIPHRHLRHEPGQDSAHIARLRAAQVDGVDQSWGVKALLVKAGSRFTLVALRTHLALDNRALRRELGVSKLRFARREELATLTGGLVPGQVPPLGEPLLSLPLVADHSVWARPELAFTCGTHTDSLLMSVHDWAELASPRRLAFSKEQPTAQAR